MLQAPKSHTCETFGHLLPTGLEPLYHKLIKSALNVRPNTPNDIVLIESGLFPLKALVMKRQLGFYRRFRKSLQKNSARESVFNELCKDENKTKYIKYYIQLDERYRNPNDVLKEALSELKRSIQEKAQLPDQHYRFYIYHELNPQLLPSPFLTCASGADAITRFRLGSHNLPIEMGRWSRTRREERLCNSCQILCDERHVLFHCSDVQRNPSHNFTEVLSDLWKNKDIFELFHSISKTEYL